MPRDIGMASCPVRGGRHPFGEASDIVRRVMCGRTAGQQVHTSPRLPPAVCPLVADLDSEQARGAPWIRTFEQLDDGPLQMGAGFWGRSLIAGRTGTNVTVVTGYVRNPSRHPLPVDADRGS